MEWLSNIYDPKKPNAKLKLALQTNETREQAWANHLAWLSGKIIGEPVPPPNSPFTMKELKDMGMVGVYEA